MNFFDSELINPKVHCFGRCFVCKCLVPIVRDDTNNLDLSERKCPKCGTFLEEEQVAGTFFVTLIHTGAITSSKKIAGFDLATIPYVAASGLGWMVGLPFWFRSVNNFVYLFPVFLLVRWFFRYWYRVRFTDDEYQEAVSEMKRSLGLWLAANIICWMVLFFLKMKKPAQNEWAFLDINPANSSFPTTESRSIIGCDRRSVPVFGHNPRFGGR